MTNVDPLGPHHDGSELYMSNAAPRLGDTVSVWVRVPADRPVASVHARITPDCEQQFVGATVDRIEDGATWWRADLRVHNPVTRYRFILKGGATGYQWLNGTGTHERDVTDHDDFRIVSFDAPPAWAAEAVVYQIFPDRFAKGAEREAPEWAVPAAWDDPLDLSPQGIGTQWYGGDLDGVAGHLDHLERLGVNTIYLTPFFPGRSNHRYDAHTFDQVDDALGGDDALARLVAAARGRGMRVLGDLTTNHTGSSHEWFKAAHSDPASPERDFYLWTAEGDYVSWLGVTSLPKLNHDSDELRHRLFDGERAVAAHWVGPEGGLDGWRVDVANMTGRYQDQDRNHEVARWMRASMLRANRDALLIAEHAHDYGPDAIGDGWHGVMNYAGFTKPVWTWLRDSATAPQFLGSPLRIPRLGAEAVVATMRDFAAQVPWRTLVHSFNLLGSHDTTRVRTLVGPDSRMVDVAAGLMFTLPGIPMLTYGDEIGMRGEFGEDGRRPFPWDESAWDGRLFEAYRELVALRRASHALRHGGLRWVHAEGDVMVFLRESASERVLVQASRAAHGAVRLDARAVGADGDLKPLIGRPAERAGAELVLVADGPVINVWQLPRDR
jgi:alpha-glucosidase